MKPLLLHGPAIVSSRAKLTSLKKPFNGQVSVFEKGSDLQMMINYLITPSLLSEKQLIILENPPEDFVLDSSLITHHSSLILWFDHEVSSNKRVVQWIKKQNGEMLFFPEAKEVSVFPFLDLLGNKDKRAFLELDKLKRAGFDMQYFLTMVFYLLRSWVSPTPKAPSFVKQKLAKQKANFSDIAKLYQEILRIDFKIKSGLLETSQAEFLLIDSFLR